jgi:hypothetical protein
MIAFSNWIQPATLKSKHRMAPVIASGWTVEAIDIVGEEGAKLHLKSAEGHHTILHTPDFGVGQRGPKAAALARFAEHCGFGNRYDIYEFIWALPEDWSGPLLPVAHDDWLGASLECDVF